MPAKSLPIFTVCLLLALTAARPAHGLTQAEALAEAAAVNQQGSDGSLQNSTTSAMRAMLELANQNRPGAMKNGYKAFGEYRTSEDLDIVRMKNRIRQIDMFTSNVSIDSKIPAWAKKKEIFTTTYGRLDPKFLRQGDAAKVAEEFERKSGMRREDFLKKMAVASESRISGRDPQLVDKVLGRFESFVDDIPNESFRNTVKKEISAVSPKSRAGLIRDGVNKLGEILASHGISVGVKPVELAAAPSEPEPSREPASAPVASSAFTGELPAKKEDPLSSAKKNFMREMASSDSEFRGLEKEKFSGDPLGSVMQTALDEQTESTIFKQVSRRYRAVTPHLSLVKE